MSSGAANAVRPDKAAGAARRLVRTHPWAAAGLCLAIVAAVVPERRGPRARQRADHRRRPHRVRGRHGTAVGHPAGPVRRPRRADAVGRTPNRPAGQERRRGERGRPPSSSSTPPRSAARRRIGGPSCARRRPRSSRRGRSSASWKRRPPRTSCKRGSTWSVPRLTRWTAASSPSSTSSARSSGWWTPSSGWSRRRSGRSPNWRRRRPPSRAACGGATACGRTSTASSAPSRSLQVEAPSAGTVSLMPNPRSGSATGRQPGLPRRRPRVARGGDRRAARPVVGAPHRPIGRIRPRPRAGGAAGYRAPRRGARQGLPLQGLADFPAGARGFREQLAARPRLRPRARDGRSRRAAEAGDDRQRPDRGGAPPRRARRAGAGRDARQRPADGLRPERVGLRAPRRRDEAPRTRAGGAGLGRRARASAWRWRTPR